MFEFFVITVAVPVVVAIVLFTQRKELTAVHLLALIIAAMVVSGTAAGIVSCSNTSDIETWNGRVSHKDRDEVSCDHSYQCNCHETCTGTGSNRNCSTTCDTCYEHSYDVDWDVTTTNHETFTIDRVDRQGLHEPSRWMQVHVGDPTSVPHRYDNYVKAAPGSLFRHQGVKGRYQVPARPTYYDYHRFDHLVTVGDVALDLAERRAWNHDLAELNADLGSSKQANIIVVIINDLPDDFYYALEEAWIGGKKNDVIVLVSIDPGQSVKWAAVMCWTTNELFKVQLRDHIMAEPRLDRAGFIKILASDVGVQYKRKPMKDFEYLKASIVPSTLQWVLTLVIALAINVGLVIAFIAREQRTRPRWCRS